MYAGKTPLRLPIDAWALWAPVVPFTGGPCLQTSHMRSVPNWVRPLPLPSRPRLTLTILMPYVVYAEFDDVRCYKLGGSRGWLGIKCSFKLTRPNLFRTGSTRAAL